LEKTGQSAIKRKVYKWEIAWYLYCRAYPSRQLRFWEDLPADIQRSWLVKVAEFNRHQRYYYACRIRGLCVHCGKPLEKFISRCKECSMKETKRMREKYGHSEWKPGSRGNPPKYKEAI
jgi:hypothetical protein